MHAAAFHSAHGVAKDREWPFKGGGSPRSVRIGLIAFTTLALLAVRPAEAQTEQADGT